MAPDRAILGRLSGVLASPRARVWVITLCLLGGIAVSLFLYSRAGEWETAAVRAELNDRGRECADLLHINVLRSMDVLQSIAALSSIQRSDGAAYEIAGPRPEQFRTFVSPALARQPELLAIGWIPRVLDSQRVDFESALHLQNPLTLTLLEQASKSGNTRTWKTADRRPEYFPVYLIEPQNRNAAAVGFDLASERVRADALARARDSALPAATPVLRLVQESGDRPGFIVYVPVYASSTQGESAGAPPDIETRRRTLSGYASAVFCVEDLVRPVFDGLVAKGYCAQLIDAAEPSRIISAAGPRANPLPRGSGSIESVTELNFAGRTWLLNIEPTPERIAMMSRAGRQPRATLLGGLSITLLLTAYLTSAARAAGRVERRVLERTAELSREVIDRQRAEAAARAAEAKYRSIFENSVEGLFQTTPAGQYLSANRALANVYGYQSIDHLIADLTNIAAELYVNAGRRDEFVRQVQQNDAVWEFESEVRRRDGTIIWISENARAVRGPDGQILYYEGSVLDITARKRSDELLRLDRDHLEQVVLDRTKELARANESLQLEITVRRGAEAAAASASAAKSEFLSRMSHEIRTPMNAILGYAQLLARDPTLAPRHQEVIRTVVGSGNHLIGLLNDVLDLAKIEAGHVEVRCSPFDLAALVHDVTAIVRGRCADKGLHLRVEFDASLKWARTRSLRLGDERKLRQVLINLLGNAVQFTDAGTVTLRIECDGEADRIAFEVADSGIGIDPSRQAEIFEPFRQANISDRGGTGLGLAIARQHVMLMGGGLRLQSEMGEGTRVGFTLALPATSPASAPGINCGGSPIGDRFSLPAQRIIRALVVDDVQMNCDVLAGMLSLIGCEVTVANNESAVLEVAAVGGPFDLMFIDVVMPGRTGAKIAERIQRSADTGSPLKLIATSASVLSHERAGFRDAGFHDFLLKPLQIEEVYECVCHALDIQPVSAASQEESSSVPRSDARPGLELLPQHVRLALAEAAEMCRVTEMKQLIDTMSVDESSAASNLPAVADAQEFLRACLRRYDMDAIRDALAEVSCA